MGLLLPWLRPGVFLRLDMTTVKKPSNDGDKKLTPKQMLFVKEYLVDLNATQAAIRAGYELKRFGTGYYVYLLINPFTKKIIYIGKGKGRRLLKHRAEVNRGVVNNLNKFSEIYEIEQLGNKVIEKVLVDELSESDAFALEKYLINSFKQTGITNIANGIEQTADKIKFKARLLLDKLKPFDAWVCEIDKESLSLVNRVFGNAEFFYNYIKRNLTTIAR